MYMLKCECGSPYLLYKIKPEDGDPVLSCNTVLRGGVELGPNKDLPCCTNCRGLLYGADASDFEDVSNCFRDSFNVTKKEQDMFNMIFNTDFVLVEE